MSRIKIATFECDACGRVENVELSSKKSVKKPVGFHGNAEAITPTTLGSLGVKVWFACSVQCIQEAILSVTNQKSSESPEKKQGKNSQRKRRKNYLPCELAKCPSYT